MSQAQTLAEMAGELGLEKFRAEFEKLYSTLMAVHENERKLTKKCLQLNDEIADNMARVSAVLDMTQQEVVVNADVRQVCVHTVLYSYGGPRSPPHLIAAANLRRPTQTRRDRTVSVGNDRVC